MMREQPVRKPLDYYLSLRYPILVYEDEEGGYVAEVPDLPGCLTQAETLPELFEMIEDARRLWIEVAYEEGKEIPLPRTEAQYSGRFVVRLPASLHRRLAQAAAEEGVSLNQYVVHLLATGANLDLFARRIERRLDAIGAAVAAIERSINYAMGPIPRSPARIGMAPVMTFSAGTKRTVQQAVAS